MTTDRLARIYEWYAKYDGLGYYAGAGDNDRDGLPDRADVNDGNGVDCSGAQWAAFAYAWQPDPPPFPLGSTSSYAAMARDRGWFVPLSQVQPGDILLHATNGDIYHSDGPVGHTEMFGGRAPGGKWICWGSASSGRGVGYVVRSPSFWQAAFRIPGLEDHSQPSIREGFLMALSDADQAKLALRVQNINDKLEEMLAHSPRDPNRPWVGLLARLDDVPQFITEIKTAGGFAWSNLLTRLSKFLPK